MAYKEKQTEQSKKREMRKTEIYFMTFVHTNDILEKNIVLSSRVPELFVEKPVANKKPQIETKRMR